MAEEQLLNEREQSPVQLASAWAKREIDEANRRLIELRASEHFYATYNPEFHPFPEDAEPGSMMWSMAKNEGLAAEDFDDRRDYELERIRKEIRDQLERATLADADLMLVEDGDYAAIVELSELEKRRMDVEAERQRRKLEYDLGIKFEGVAEVGERVKLVINKGRELRSNTDVGDGWRFTDTSENGRAFVRGDGQGPLGHYSEVIGIQRQFVGDDEPGTGIRFRRLTDTRAVPVPAGVRAVGQGTAMHFRIDGDRVRRNQVNEMEAVHKFGDHGPVDVRFTEPGRPMNQQDFNQFRQSLSSLHQALSTS